MEEVERIKQAYKDRAGVKTDYSTLHPTNHYLVLSREKLLFRLLYENFGTDLSNLKVLDVGFGGGGDIFNLVRLGVGCSNLFGVEILKERLERMQEILPATNLQQIEGFNLPFEDNSMDLLIQSTVFSSILDPGSRKQLAAEIYRVLKPGGAIISYDMRISNPWNKNVTKIDKIEFKRLFPQARLTFYPVTLNPVLARRLGRYSVILCEILEKLSLLCSHYYTVIRKE